ncbi:MAG TPA: hypothetical protein VHI78_09580 [Bacteroidales bacterium]|jgi:hypothetical protein|nr:hypothetical protein [Bacteroidales bacterium]
MKVTVLFAFALLFAGNCRDNKGQNLLQEDYMQFSGSTPGDSIVKLILGIPVTDSIDFMKWDLIFRNDGRQIFSLSINYGLARPNTSGFKENAGILTIKGESKVTFKELGHFKDEVIHLISDSFTNDTLSLVKLDNSLLHILNPDYRLMVGNGGWSYTLNRTDESIDNSGSFHSLIPVDSILSDSTFQMVFDGRTPCSEIAQTFGFSTNPDCLKLKWRIKLNWDPVTLKPTSYEIERTDIRSTGSITGNWTITILHGSAIIFRLDPDKPDKSISFLVGDENVLFFLDKNNRLFKGNKDFSYTVNRKNPV